MQVSHLGRVARDALHHCEPNLTRETQHQQGHSLLKLHAHPSTLATFETPSAMLTAYTAKWLSKLGNKLYTTCALQDKQHCLCDMQMRVNQHGFCCQGAVMGTAQYICGPGAPFRRVIPSLKVTDNCEHLRLARNAMTSNSPAQSTHRAMNYPAASWSSHEGCSCPRAGIAPQSCAANTQCG